MPLTMLISNVVDLHKFSFHYLPSIDSTNSYAKLLVSNSEPNQYIVVYTDHQTAGRGQYGSQWDTTKDENIALSIVIPIDTVQDTQSLFVWNIYVANVLRQFIADIVENDTYVKWPNDIIVGDKKVAGILIENIFRGDKLSHCIIGIGINVNQDDFEQHLPNATSLTQVTSKNYDTTTLVHELVAAFDFDTLLNNNSSVTHQILLKKYNQHLFAKNQRVNFKVRNKNILEKGKILKINLDGNMIVNQNGFNKVLQHGNYKQIL